MLRILFVAGLLAVGFRYSLKAPFYALLLYLFVAYFRPDYWVWSDIFATMNLSFIVGIWVVGYVAIERPSLAVGRWPLVLVAFLLHALVSALLSTAEYSFVFWQEFAKTILVGYLCVVLLDDEKKLRLALLVVAFSLGFEGAKQGWTTLFLSPGSTNTNGWPMLGDNNGVAIGMLMMVSLFMAMSSTAPHWMERYLERFFLIGVMYRALSTYSRGGFLSLAALVVYLILRSRRKVAGALTLAVALGLIVPVLPDAFWERMQTIRTSAEAESPEEVETSAAGRLHFWQVAVVMADTKPIFGVGPWAFNFVYDDYDFSDGAFGSGRSVHSAWFGLLAETGYVGLGLVVLLFINAALVTRRVRKMARARPDMSSLAAYATGLEGALLVAVVGGTFYPFQYMEPLWHTLALSMAVGRVADKRWKESIAAEAAAAPAPPARVHVDTAVQLPRSRANVGLGWSDRPALPKR
jgi:putative inorganic carbon (HCO3(-)) transporter